MRLPTINQILRVLMVIAGSQTAAQSQDKLIVPDGSAPSGDSLFLPISIDGPSAVVAMQFDLRYSKTAVEVLGPVSAGGSNHRVFSREVSEGLRRIVVYSRSNAVLPKDVVIDLPMVMSATASGNPSPALRIENLCFALEDGTKVTPEIERGPIDTWFATHFTFEQLSDPAFYGDSADPDGDELPNLMEYGVGGNPLIPDDDLVPAISSVLGTLDEKLLQLRFHRARQAPGVSVESEISSDLVNWDPLAALPTGAGDALTIEFAAEAAVGERLRQFVRISVKRESQ